MFDPEKRPKVGLGIIVLNDKKVILGKRRNAHGAGTWCFPGGHLERGESFIDCAYREIAEETDLDVKIIDSYPVAVTNDIFPDRHYITLFLRANYHSGTLKVKEPDKCERWGWFNWFAMPPEEQLFLPIRNLLARGYNPFEEHGGVWQL